MDLRHAIGAPGYTKEQASACNRDFSSRLARNPTLAASVLNGVMRFATSSAVAALALAGVFLLAQNSAPTKNSIGMEFVKIAPGEFVMGCSTDNADCNDDEKPAHRVQITKSFEIGKYEVTQAQWQAIVGSNPSANKGDNRPVETVSKGEVHEFLNRLNARNDGYKYRLPTEAEWEYAATAGSPEPAGAALEEFAWYAANSGDETHPVGQKKPNAWGLYDMLGNVMEWTLDQYAPYTASAQVNPWVKATQPYPNAVRGGSWNDPPEMVRCTSRVPSDASWKQQDPQLPKSIWYMTDAQWLGFRLVRPAKLPTADEMYRYWNSGLEHDEQ